MGASPRETSGPARMVGEGVHGLGYDTFGPLLERMKIERIRMSRTSLISTYI